MIDLDDLTDKQVAIVNAYSVGAISAFLAVSDLVISGLSTEDAQETINSTGQIGWM